MSPYFCHYLTTPSHFSDEKLIDIIKFTHNKLLERSKPEESIKQYYNQACFGSLYGNRKLYGFPEETDVVVFVPIPDFEKNAYHKQTSFNSTKQKYHDIIINGINGFVAARKMPPINMSIDQVPCYCVRLSLNEHIAITKAATTILRYIWETPFTDLEDHLLMVENNTKKDTDFIHKLHIAYMLAQRNHGELRNCSGHSHIGISNSFYISTFNRINEILELSKSENSTVKSIFNYGASENYTIIDSIRYRREKGISDFVLRNQPVSAVKYMSYLSSLYDSDRKIIKHLENIIK